jgi:predicted DNA-binding transcriptional regulator AlpA
MQHRRPAVRKAPAPDTVEVAGETYFPAATVCRLLSISRQTLWRWGADGKAPRGWRYRDRQLLFTAQELEALRRYADRLEPLAPVPSAPSLDAPRRARTG